MRRGLKRLLADICCADDRASHAKGPLPKLGVKLLCNGDEANALTVNGSTILAKSTSERVSRPTLINHDRIDPTGIGIRRRWLFRWEYGTEERVE
jgi:hypothetical protein